MEELIRDVGEEKVVKSLQQVIKNNEIILNLQKQLITLKGENTEKKEKK